MLSALNEEGGEQAYVDGESLKHQESSSWSCSSCGEESRNESLEGVEHLEPSSILTKSSMTLI